MERKVSLNELKIQTKQLSDTTRKLHKTPKLLIADGKDTATFVSHANNIFNLRGEMVEIYAPIKSVKIIGKGDTVLLVLSLKHQNVLVIDIGDKGIGGKPILRPTFDNIIGHGAFVVGKATSYSFEPALGYNYEPAIEVTATRGSIGISDHLP